MFVVMNLQVDNTNIHTYINIYQRGGDGTHTQRQERKTKERITRLFLLCQTHKIYLYKWIKLNNTSIGIPLFFSRGHRR